MPYRYREHFPFRIRIRNKILIPLLCISLGITLVSILASTRILENRMYELISADMYSSANAVDGLIDKRLQELVSTAQLMAEMNVTPGAAGKMRDTALPRRINRLLEEDGFSAELVPSRRDFPAGTVVSGRNSKGVVWGFRRSASDGALSLFAETPYPATPGMSILLRSAIIGDSLLEVKRVTGLEILIIDHRNALLAGTMRGSVITGFLLENLPRIASFAPEQRGGRIEVGGLSYSYHMVPIMARAQSVATCVLIRSNADLIAWQKEIRSEILLAALLLVAATSLFYWFILNRITRPLSILTAAADQVGAGDLSVETEIRTRDEIGLLAQAFSTMTASLRANQRELQDAALTIIHQEKLASMGQMVAGIMHETKNPLNAISILLTLARGAAGEDERNSYLDQIKAEVLRISHAVEQLLAISRKPEFELEKIDVNERIQAFLARMDFMFAAAGAELVTEFAPELPELEINVGHLDQILYNLTTNALQAMVAGGRLGVRTRIVTDDRKRADHLACFLCIGVEDTGCGIPRELQGKVFDPFMTTKPAGQGTGLGLSIVRGIMESYGGKVRLSSEVGRGTTVEVLFPILRCAT